MSAKVYILDEIDVMPPRLAELRHAYLNRYGPAARARGMTLKGAWRSPPVTLPDRPSTLHFLWSVPDVAGWWGMRLGTARANAELDVPIEGDDDKLRWWSFVDSIASSRRRTFLVDAEGDNGDA